jgi:hypothetical protein
MENVLGLKVKVRPMEGGFDGNFPEACSAEEYRITGIVNQRAKVNRCR